MSLPKNKSTQAALHIREQIINGLYENTLPSERILSEQLLISRNCVRDALAILTRDGLLSPPEQSRRRSILKTTQANHAHTQKISRCIVLTPNTELNSTEQFLGQLSRLRSLLASAEIFVEVRSSPAFRTTAPQQQLEELTASLPNSIWLLHLCPESIQKWFESSGLFCVVFGSKFTNIDLQSVDSDHAAAVRHATGRLLKLGHRHMSLLIPRTTLAGSQMAEAAFQETLSRSHHDTTAQVLRHDFNLPRLTDTLTKIFSKATPPTALIVQNSHHFLTVYSHLLSLKLSIPRDISILCLAHSSCFERLSPTPTHYSTGVKFIRSLANTIINCPERRKTNAMLIPDYKEGSTIGPVPT